VSVTGQHFQPGLQEVFIIKHYQVSYIRYQEKWSTYKRSTYQSPCLKYNYWWFRVTKITSVTIVKLVTPKAGGKRQLLFNESASGHFGHFI
jgi:hypothetical protein